MYTVVNERSFSTTELRHSRSPCSYLYYVSQILDVSFGVETVDCGREEMHGNPQIIVVFSLTKFGHPL